MSYVINSENGVIGSVRARTYSRVGRRQFNERRRKTKQKMVCHHAAPKTRHHVGELRNADRNTFKIQNVVYIVQQYIIVYSAPIHIDYVARRAGGASLCISMCGLPTCRPSTLQSRLLSSPVSRLQELWMRKENSHTHTVRPTTKRTVLCTKWKSHAYIYMLTSACLQLSPYVQLVVTVWQSILWQRRGRNAVDIYISIPTRFTRVDGAQREK